jgi:hypothetical protein
VNAEKVAIETLLTELSPGETVEWSGRPNSSVVFHPEDWLVVPFSLLWAGFAIFWTLGASGIISLGRNRPDQTFHWFGFIWGTPFVLAGQYFIWGRFLYDYWLKKRTCYAVTRRRALIICTGLTGRSSSSAYLDNLSIIDKLVRSDQIGTISFGGPVRGKWQWGRGNPPRPLTFDDIDDADSVYRLITRLQGEAQKLPFPIPDQPESVRPEPMDLKQV